MRLTSGRSTFNAGESGVTLHNMTAKDLQKMVEIRKVTLPATANSDAVGAVYYLPQSLVDIGPPKITTPA